MFKAVTFPEWTTLCGIIAFVLTFAVFVAIVVRALRMPRKEVNRMSAMPLESEKQKENDE